MFRVGQHVVCVDDKNTTLVTVGAIYVIRAVDGRFVDLVGVHGLTGRHDGMYARRFRPVTSPKQEVSFTTGAPVDSERWDNRVKRKPQKAITALHS